jgi:Zn-dependent peptidase ImmA (M78 family)
MTQAQLIAAASGAALRAHRSHNLDRQRRIDVFDVLRSAASDVFFRPLKRICGAYIPSEGQIPGVLINSSLPLSRQRYTAAHEFGHLFLNHSVVSVDEMVGVSFEERGHWSYEENIAETFAAFFLMPDALVETSLRELGGPDLTPENIYLLSLKMGTSYLATVNHLQTIKKLSQTQARAFRRIQPKTIKTGISPSVASRHDVWVLDEHWNGQPIFPAIEDTVVVRLQEVPTSGYTWVWHRNPVSLRLIHDGFADKATAEVGGARVRQLVMQVSSVAQAERIDLERRQPWDADSEATARFSVDLFPQETRKSGPLVLPTLE